MFGVYFKNQKGSVMKKVLSKIFVIFAFCFSFTETYAQYKIEQDGWGGEYMGQLVATGYHVCGSFFDKIPLSLLVQCESAKNIYHVSCLLSLYSPCEFPPRGILLLKTDKGEVIELSCGANGGNIKKEQRLDGKVFYRYRAVVFFEIKEEKLAGTPCLLYHTSEHPQGKHIEEKMLKTAMQKEVGEELIIMEVFSKKEMQSTPVCEFKTSHLKHPRSQETQHIDDEQVLRYYRNISHVCRSLCIVLINLFRGQNYEKSSSNSSKISFRALFLMKKAVFSTYFFVLLIVSIIFADEITET